jgi:hypothetical protein
LALTTDELESKETVEEISVQDVGIRTLAEKLTEEQEKKRLTLCIDFAEQLQEDNFLDRVIVCD